MGSLESRAYPLLRKWAETLRLIDQAAVETDTLGMSEDSRADLVACTLRCLLAFDPEGTLQRDTMAALLRQVPPEFRRLEPGFFFALQRADAAAVGVTDTALAASEYEQDGPASRIALGCLLIERGQRLEGAQVILSAAEDYPEDPRAVLFAGWITLHIGDSESALAFATAAGQQAPGDPGPSLLECQALAALGRAHEAIERLNAHVERFPQDRSAWELLAKVAERVGDRQAARAAKKRAAHLGSRKREYST